MVLFNTNSFVLVTLTLLLALPMSVSAQQNSSVKKSTSWLAQMRTLQRVGVQGITLPQKVQLKSSLGNSSEILVSQSGLGISYDYEGRVQRLSLMAGLGVSFTGIQASSASDSLSYSYSTSNNMNYMLSLGAYYITESYVRVGLGLRSFYSAFELQTPQAPGAEYSFEYGSPFKNYLSFELNWQVASRYILAQSMMHPLSSELGTGWALSLKRSF